MITIRRKARFYYVVDIRGFTKLLDIFRAENVRRNIRYFWLRLRKEFRSLETKRTRK